MLPSLSYVVMTGVEREAVEFDVTYTFLFKSILTTPSKFGSFYFLFRWYLIRFKCAHMHAHTHTHIDILM